MLRNIRMAFHFLDKDMMRKNITSMIRPKLEYAEVIWWPHKKKNVLKIEKIQKIANKMVSWRSNIWGKIKRNATKHTWRKNLITIYRKKMTIQKTPVVPVQSSAPPRLTPRYRLPSHPPSKPAAPTTQTGGSYHSSLRHKSNPLFHSGRCTSSTNKFNPATNPTWSQHPQCCPSTSTHPRKTSTTKYSYTPTYSTP